MEFAARRAGVLGVVLWALQVVGGEPQLGPGLTNKTLVAWVHLADTQQQGGSAVTLMEGEDFDALVFGEREPGRWMAGSDFFRRTQSVEGQRTNRLETVTPDRCIPMAVVYEADRITVYRDGEVYTDYRVSQARSFGTNATVLLGLRYLGQMGEIGFLNGALEEVRLYDVALSAAEVGRLVPSQTSVPAPVAWWTFEDGRAEDQRGMFPATRLEGNARVEGGKLWLDGHSYLWAARHRHQLRTGCDESAPFDGTVQTLFYKARASQTGNMWDTWLYHHEGTHYLYYLARCGGQWDNISLARSPDGVHWSEVGRVLAKGRGVTWMGTGSTWKSPEVEREGRFLMNFSEWRGPRQTIFFAESRDLVHWTRLGSEYEFVQDERWYERNGRWDCIWTVPRPGGGLYGYWTATPKAETGGRFGFGETRDGVTWQALPPPEVLGVGEGEVGAVERIGERYYMMFGTGGLMVTLVAERPEGPFRAAGKNRQLLAGHTYFSRFYPAPEGLLANHHAIARDGQVSFGTLKAATLDAEGTLRLGWWTGNERLKQEPIPIGWPGADPTSRAAVTWLRGEFNPRRGVVLEGTLRLPRSRESEPIGLVVAQENGAGTAILVKADGVTELGSVHEKGTDFRPEKRVDREWPLGSTARFRLLVRGSLMEFYLGDWLIECYSLPAQASGRIGVYGEKGEDCVTDLAAWHAAAP